MFKNILKVLISNIVVLGTSFINTLIIPRLLSIEEYAQYQTFILYVSYVGLMTLGFHSGLFIKYSGKKREHIDKAQYKSEIRLIIYSQLILTVVVIAIAVLGKNRLLFCMALCILTSNFIAVFKYLYQAWNRFGVYSVISIMQSLGISGTVLIVGVIRGGLLSRDIISIYILVNLLSFLLVYVSYRRDVKGIKSNKIFSKANGVIFQTGLLLMASEGISTLFNSIDKFFVKGLFTSYEFSMYCFGITLLSAMHVFISAIAQPMYLQLALDINNTEKRKEYKELVYCFGALSGCAYYAVCIIVKYFLPHYTDSLKIVSILFAIFPAYSVISCIYVNLYKATNQIKKYISSLVLVVLCAIALNALGILIYRNFIIIAVATTICYYVWLVYSSRHFKGLELKKRDVIFLTGFFVIFFVVTRIQNAVIGFLVYGSVMLLWESVIYKERFGILVQHVKKWTGR